MAEVQINVCSQYTTALVGNYCTRQASLVYLLARRCRSAAPLLSMISGENINMFIVEKFTAQSSLLATD